MECHMGTGEIVRLEGCRDKIVLHCLRGALWLTNGNGVDYLLHPANRYEVTDGEAVVVEALDEAEVRLLRGGSREAAIPVPFFCRS